MSNRAIGLDQLSEEVRATLAHELRTPVAIIAGYAELLRVRSDEPTRSEAIARISEAADRLTEMIERLLGTQGEP